MSLRYSKLKIAVFLYISLPVSLSRIFSAVECSIALHGGVCCHAVLCLVLRAGKNRKKERAAGAHLGGAVSGGAALDLSGRAERALVPDDGLGLPQCHFPGSDHARMAGAL